MASAHPAFELPKGGCEPFCAVFEEREESAEPEERMEDVAVARDAGPRGGLSGPQPLTGVAKVTMPVPPSG